MSRSVERAELASFEPMRRPYGAAPRGANLRKSEHAWKRMRTRAEGRKYPNRTSAKAGR
jgi:hypothetical protein